MMTSKLNLTSYKKYETGIGMICLVMYVLVAFDILTLIEEIETRKEFVKTKTRINTKV